MELTEDLPVYHAMYNLLMMVMDARGAFDKSCKYIVGDNMVERCLQCLSLVHYANEDRRKGAREEHLSKFLIEFDIFKTLLMVCRDRRQFKKSTVLADIFSLTADVENQITAWRRSSRAAAKNSEAAGV